MEVNQYNTISGIGRVLLLIALSVFMAMPFFSTFQLNTSDIDFDSEVHKRSIIEQISDDHANLNIIQANQALNRHLYAVQDRLESTYDSEKVSDEWQHKLGSWRISEYKLRILKNSHAGMVARYPWLFIFLTFGLAIIGGFITFIPIYKAPPGIKNNGVFHNSLTKGIPRKWQRYIGYTIVPVMLIVGALIGGGTPLTLILTLITGVAIYLRVERSSFKDRASGDAAYGAFAVIASILLVMFYIALYWFPMITTAWTTAVDPISRALSGNPASHWFLYGLMYTVVVIVMGIRMIIKYRHVPYQIYRTLSVMFFQTAFAFLIPEILVRLNQPYYDFKNIWPLNYSFFFDYNIKSLMASGHMGLFMLVWGILLTLIGVPLFTYFFGKRWYCSWVCGCGGLAETLGDPFRHLSDNSIKAWKYERWIIHSVLAFAVLMTIMVLYTYFSGETALLGISSESIRTWYGFLIGSAFAGVVGTGFYPIMGSRVWCRFGCPLAAYLGIVQRFKSRFRITTNGGQCISCGNCSTYCEMGIDVRAYAQRGQDIQRASCVGCGICSAVCPRGVLKLENLDAKPRHTSHPLIHIQEADVRILN